MFDLESLYRMTQMVIDNIREQRNKQREAFLIENNAHPSRDQLVEFPMDMDGRSQLLALVPVDYFKDHQFLMPDEARKFPHTYLKW